MLYSLQSGLLLGIVFTLFIGLAISISPRFDRNRRGLFAIGLFLSGATLLVPPFLHESGIVPGPFVLALLAAAAYSVGPFYYLFFGSSERDSPRLRASSHFTISAAVLILLLISAMRPAGPLVPTLIPDLNFSILSRSLAFGAGLHLLYYQGATILVMAGRKSEYRRTAIAFVCAYACLNIAVIASWLIFHRAGHVFAALFPLVLAGHFVFDQRWRLFGGKIRNRGARSKLQEGSERIATELLRLMEERKPYLDDSLSLDDLASELKTSRHELSHLLNTHLGRNFNSFVNQYRIEEAKRLLATEGDERLLDIAFLAGFQSKSNFNRLFKSETGLTPRAYRKRCGL